ncbi:MAG: hypothetical protein GY950_10520 [bacterium]|nr:hypothetical protein [bacterium]
MKSRMFLLTEGKKVFVRDTGGTEVSFTSVEEFDKYYPGTIDLTGEYYVDYEPERSLLYKAAEGNFEPLVNQWVRDLEVYEDVIGHAADMLSKMEDPYFDLTLEQAKEYRRGAIKSRTYTVVTGHMPEWRQLKWRDYMSLHERVQAGDTLNELDQFAYDCFLDDGETHESAYGTCKQAFQWVLQCVTANNAAEQQVPGCSSLQQLKDLSDPDYPGWDL